MDKVRPIQGFTRSAIRTTVKLWGH